jgi:predicted Ser/Thr protein kinase
MAGLHDMTLEELRAHAVTTFRAGGGSRPEVVLVEAGGERAVLKDYARSDPAFRRVVGPLSARREAQALARLAGVPGVPRLLRRVGRDAVLIEHIAGRSMREVRRGELAPGFFERMYALIARMHARGVAHCDLRSTGNILVTPAGEPYFVDFVAHFKRARRWNPLTRWLYAKLCEADRTAVARLKKTHAPELLTAAEHAALARDRKTALERTARWLARGIRAAVRRLLTRDAG